jgi:hypothetical protein
MRATGANTICTVGASFDIVSLLVSLFVLSIIVVYLILRVYYGSMANSEFQKYSRMIYLAMIAIFVCKLIAVVLTSVSVAQFDAGNFGEGYPMLVTSCALYLLVLFL